MADSLVARVAHSGSRRRIRGKPVECTCEGGGIIRLDQEAVHLVLDELGVAADARAHDREPGRHRFENRHRQILRASGKYEDVRLPQSLADVADVAGKHSVEAELPGPRLEYGALRAVAENLEPKGHLRNCGCFEQHVDSLATLEQGGTGNDDRLAAPVVGTLPELNAVRDHVKAIARKAVLSKELRECSRGDDDCSQIAQQRLDPKQAVHEPCLSRTADTGWRLCIGASYPSEDLVRKAVEGVDGTRPAYACLRANEQSGSAIVGVHHVGVGDVLPGCSRAAHIELVVERHENGIEPESSRALGRAARAAEDCDVHAASCDPWCQFEDV